MTASGTPEAPAWFRRAIGRRPDHRELVVAGRRIHRLQWDAPEAETCVLLVHGGAAHAAWWSHVAPLMPRHHVAAVDLSGHGDSDWRDDYSFVNWAAEVMAVAEAASEGRPIVLVGHSMGGIVAAMALELGAVAGLIMVDAPLRQSATRPSVQDSEAAFRRVRLSPDRRNLVDRFRPLPDQPVEHPALLRHVAEHSVRAVRGGWSWKFDPKGFGPGRGRPEDVLSVLRRHSVPVGAIVAGRSPIVSAADRTAFRDLANRRDGARGRYVELPDAHHHVMFDHPRDLAAAVDRMVDTFSGGVDGSTADVG